jgi:hypothetical protein
MPFDEQPIDEHHECRREIEELNSLVKELTMALEELTECFDPAELCAIAKMWHENAVELVAMVKKRDTDRLADAICVSLKELLK